MRDNWINQGVLFNLRWSYKKIDRPKILVVCDVSGSVGAYARFMLLFLFSLTEVVSKIRAFVFSSYLGEVTDEFKGNNLEKAIESALSKKDSIKGILISSFSGKTFPPAHLMISSIVISI